jgi:hypothetical protein
MSLAARAPARHVRTSACVGNGANRRALERKPCPDKHGCPIRRAETPASSRRNLLRYVSTGSFDRRNLLRCVLTGSLERGNVLRRVLRGSLERGNVLRRVSRGSLERGNVLRRVLRGSLERGNEIRDGGRGCTTVTHLIRRAENVRAEVRACGRRGKFRL